MIHYSTKVTNLKANGVAQFWIDVARFTDLVVKKVLYGRYSYGD